MKSLPGKSTFWPISSSAIIFTIENFLYSNAHWVLRYLPQTEKKISYPYNYKSEIQHEFNEGKHHRTDFSGAN